MEHIKENRTIQFTDSLFWKKDQTFLQATEAEFITRLEKRQTTYEVIDKDDFKYCLYLDSDIDTIARETFTEQLCNTVEIKEEQYLRSALIALMGQEFEPNITIATSHTGNYKEDQTKISVRLYVSNVIATKHQQRKFAHQLNLMAFENKRTFDNIFEYIPPMEHLFDEGVYDSNRKMRCLNTSKPNECRPLILVKGNLINTIITRCDLDARIMEDFNDGQPVYTKSNFVSPFDNGITESTMMPELLFYAESGAFANLVGNGCHQKWLSLAGMLVSILPVEDAFTCWEQATIRDGTTNKQTEYETKFNHVKKLMDDPLKAMNTLKKAIKRDYPTIAQQWKQHADIAKETAKQQMCDSIKAQKEAIKIQQKDAIKIQLESTIEIGQTYAEMKIEFEISHFKVIDSALFMTILTSGDINIQTKQSLLISCEHLRFEKIIKGEIVSMGFVAEWLKDPSMRRYDSADVYPPDQQCPDNVFNMWVPFAMESVSVWTHHQDGLDMFRKHILIMCNNEEHIAFYFEKWISQMIQYPSVKTICPTIISSQGAGKGTIMKLFIKMLGQTKVLNEVSNPSRDIWGNFNSLMKQAFLVNVDELSGKDSREAVGQIKTLIKSDTISINSKGQAPIIINSYHRFLNTTNNSDPVSVSKDDRRNCVIQASDELLGNTGYFNKIYELLADVNVIKTCYEYFKSLPDADKFNSLEIPHTKYHDEMSQLNVSPIESWLRDYTEEFYNPETNVVGNTVKILSSNCFVMFNEWKDKTHMIYDVNALKFSVQMSRLKINGIESIKGAKGERLKQFDLQKMAIYYKL